jgi:serine protease Do/serine protease DegQ
LATVLPAALENEAFAMNGLRNIAAGMAALLGCLTIAVAWPTSAPVPMFNEERGVLTLAPVLERVTLGVVNIAVRQEFERPSNPLFDDPFFRRFFQLPEMPRQREVISAGSGVIVDAKRGYVFDPRF